jgi:hypothetical protein
MGSISKTQRLPGHLIGINKLALAVGALSMDGEPKARRRLRQKTRQSMAT